MRTEDEDPPTHTFVIYHLYDGSQPDEVAEGIVECFSAQLRQWLRECILPSLLSRSLPIKVWESVPILLSLHATAATETATGKLSEAASTTAGGGNESARKAGTLLCARRFCAVVWRARLGAVGCGSLLVSGKLRLVYF